MTDEIYFLDWNRDLLLGFQDSVCTQGVNMLRKAIQSGKEITPVIVQPFYNPTTYRFEDLTGYADMDEFAPDARILTLNPFIFVPRLHTRDGGHHRAVAHYLERKPLPYRWKNESDKIILEREGTPEFPWRFIREVRMKDDVLTSKGEPEWERRMELHGYESA